MEKLAGRTKDSFNEYFIAIVPPEPVYSDALKLKEYFRDHYGSKAALNSPPHITLHMPFRWTKTKENLLVKELEKFFASMSYFELSLCNFSSFPPRVIFIDVERSDLLFSLQKLLTAFCKSTLNLFNANYREMPFHAHLTLAFRDLKKQKYEEAWTEFSEKEYRAAFVVKNVALLKHDGKLWHVMRNLELRNH